MFEGNDLPGVMLCSGAQRLAALYGVAPGKAAVVATTADRGLESALALHEAGRRGRRRRRRARRAEPAAELVARLERARDPALARPAPWSAPSAAGGSSGRGRRRARSRRPGAAPTPSSDLDCDLIAVSGGTVPATSLLLQAGAKARWDEAAGAYLPEAAPPGIQRRRARSPATVAPGAAELSGAVAGAEAALSLELRRARPTAPPGGRARGS